MEYKNLMLILLCFSPFSLYSQFQNLGGPAKGVTLEVVFQNDTIYALTTASLQYSTNDGLSWNMVPGSNDLPHTLSNVEVDGQVIYLTMRVHAVTHVIYKSENFGQSWTQVQNDEFFSQVNIYDLVSFHDSLYIYTHSQLFLSQDRGETFVEIDLLAQHIPFGFLRHQVVHFENRHYFLSPEGMVKTTDFETYQLLFTCNPKNKYIIFRNESNVYLFEYLPFGQKIYKLENGSMVLEQGSINGYNIINFQDLAYDGELIYTAKSNSPIYTANAWETSNYIDLYSLFRENYSLLKIQDGVAYIDAASQLYKMSLNDLTPTNITNNLMGDKNLHIRKEGNKLVYKSDPLAYYDLIEKSWHTLGQDAPISLFLNETNLVKYDSGDTILITDIDGQVLKKSKLPKGKIYFGDYINSIDGLIFVSFQFDSLYYSSDWGDTWVAIDEYVHHDILVNKSNNNLLVWTMRGPIYTSSNKSDFVKHNTTQNGIRKTTVDNNGNVYYHDFGSLYKEDKSTGFFDKIPLPFTIEPFNDLNDFSIEHYGNALFVGGYSKGLFVTYNEGETWEAINEGLDTKNVGSIEIDDENIYLACYGHVYKRSLTDLKAETFYGEVFEDENENGIRESNESLLSDIRVRTTKNNIISSSNENGEFSIITNDVDENLVELIVPPYATATNGSLPLDNNQNLIQLGLSFDKDVDDVGFKIISPFVFRPGFDTQVELYLENFGYNDRSVDLNLLLDDKLVLLNSSYTPFNLDINSLSYENIFLSGKESTVISLLLKTDVSATIGDLVQLDADIKLIDYLDIDESNNNYQFIDTIRGSYDPNDKLVYPNADLIFDENFVDEELIYTIRFQNTGNYPAEFVRIIDTIKTDFDITSLEILSSSHLCEWSILDGRVLDFFFPNINLPDSTVSQSLSQGYVSFSIKANENITPGAALENDASIYFDFNPPIVTETVITQIVEPDVDNDGFPLSEDCDDNDPNVNPDQLEQHYNGIDDDCDETTMDDDLDQDGFVLANDCDDNNANINPGQTEIPYNGIDDDCDGSTPDDDVDQDGFLLVDDCDDNNASVNPDGIEVPYNGFDDDCDETTLDDDMDQDGFLLVDDCDDENAEINPDETEIPYNGVDDDCDATTLDDDVDQDGFLLSEDCDDNNASVNPDAIEIPYNGIDDDCNAITPDDDIDQDGFVLAVDCDDNDASVNPDATEIPYNGIDDDCDAITLDDDIDQDGFVLVDDCDDENSEINPDATEIPNNGIDEDCDGADLIIATHEINNIEIHIYPNPVAEELFIDINGQLDYAIELYNIQGQLVYSASNITSMSTENLINGTYILKFRDVQSTSHFIQKIIVSK